VIAAWIASKFIGAFYAGMATIVRLLRDGITPAICPCLVE